MKKIFLIISLAILIISNANAESLGNVRNVNYYMENGFKMYSVRVINEDKTLYNLINDGSQARSFEVNFISCVYEKSSNTTECFKP